MPRVFSGKIGTFGWLAHAGRSRILCLERESKTMTNTSKALETIKQYVADADTCDTDTVDATMTAIQVMLTIVQQMTEKEEK